MNILVTGGAGFIGTNFARIATRMGYGILALDSFAREASRRNCRLIQALPNTKIIAHNITKPLPNLSRVDCIVHLAANVDANKAFQDPKWDFRVNALGTLNVLEYARRHGDIPVIYASTCKVYSTRVNALPLVERERRYDFGDVEGIDEAFGIDAHCRYGHAPYGCSKYVGDMYAQEFHTLFGLPVVINRLSTIYGPHQHGTKGYGWVYWFTKAVKQDLPITIYGDGKQVRDVLHVDDLCRLLLKQIEEIDEHVGEIYNVGGGVAHTISLLELMDMLVELKGNVITAAVLFEDWRPADFRVYVSNITKIRQKANWSPSTAIREGVARLWKEF